ncbi:MAG: acyl-CoA/acyl-ACP dehydrogenase [Actinobacteria bacterium]|nr:acyl-CoA/acyl-ACP dehydrogenase [Actinomycetota bacterium]
MKDELDAVAATTARIFEALWSTGTEPGDPPYWAPQVWEALVKAGFTLLPIPEEHGGAGASMLEAAVVLREVGRFGVPVPLMETALLAGWLLSATGLAVPAGPLTAAAPDAMGARRVRGGYVLTGTLSKVPYGHIAENVVVVLPTTPPLVMSLDPRDWQWVRGRNLCGEPRDSINIEGLFVSEEWAAVVGSDKEINGSELMIRGALGTSLLIAGAIEAALSASVSYARERTQFGRPIIAFQAIQQYLAQMAAESAAANAAAMSAATNAARNGSPDPIFVGASKVQAGRSAGIVARLAHQVHGAIGFTQEHPLHRYTTRLWAWRDEFGNERHWARILGERALSTPGLWDLVTRDTPGEGT